MQSAGPRSRAIPSAEIARDRWLAWRAALSSTTVFWLTLGALVLVGLALRLYDLGGTDMWTDEVLSALRARAPFDEALESILGAGNQAPLYYLVMRAVPNHTSTLLRLPALIMGLINIVQLGLLVSLIYGDRPLGLQTAAILAVSPLHIILSRTARFYTLLFLLTLVALYCFVLLSRGRRNGWVWGVYIATSALAYLTHYTALGLGGTQFLFLVLRMRHERRFIVRWTVAQALAAVPWLLWIVMASLQYSGGEGFPSIPRLPTLIDLPITYLYLLTGYEGVMHWYFVPALIVGGAGLLAGGYYALRELRSEPVNFYWLLLAVVPVVVLFVMSVTVYGKYKDRYFLTLTPAIFLLFLLGWRRLAAGFAPFALAIVLLTNTYQILHIYRTGEYERSDWGGASTYIKEEWQPGDSVIFARWTTYAAFRYAYDGDSRLLDEGILLSDVEDMGAFEPGGERVWVVYRTQREDFHRQGWLRASDPFMPGVSPMSDWLLEHHDAVVSIKEFEGVSIILLYGRVEADADYSLPDLPVGEDG